MNALLKELLQMPEARALLDSTLRRDKPMVTGVSPVHRAMLAAAMFQETGRPMLLLCGDETEAMKLSGDLHALTGQNVTLLRQQSAEIVFTSYSGLRVPKSAVRVENGQTGVYILEGTLAKWKPITILHDTGESYVVTLDTSSTNNLWPGDELIINAKNLYDGKVVN